MAEKPHITAIVLAAGRGRRMGSSVPKQFLALKGREVIYYSLKAFEDFDSVQDIILVTGPDMIEQCRREIVEKYGFTKVKAVIPGGSERSDSVYEGIKAASPSDYVMIHDGARPMIDTALLERCAEAMIKHGACIAAVPVKDTIKTVRDGIVTDTPDRSVLYQVQTPQCFRYAWIEEAFRKAKAVNLQGITDDAMVLENTSEHTVAIAEGSYRNIKVTTPEDIPMAEALLES